MMADEKIIQAIVRFGCLYLAVELCKTANAFDQPERVMEIARQLEDHCMSARKHGAS